MAWHILSEHVSIKEGPKVLRYPCHITCEAMHVWVILQPLHAQRFLLAFSLNDNPSPALVCSDQMISDEIVPVLVAQHVATNWVGFELL